MLMLERLTCDRIEDCVGMGFKVRQGTTVKRFESVEKNVEFKKPNYEIISNVTADSITDPEIIKQLLIEQIYSSVKWRESILRMSKEKVRNFIEIGPGKVLTGMVKRTIKGANCFSINSIADIKILKDELKK